MGPSSEPATLQSQSCQHINNTLQGNASIEQHLADICDTIVLNGSVCQAFDYNPNSNLAFFKGQPPSQKVDFKAACVIPNVTLWVLDSGASSCNLI